MKTTYVNGYVCYKVANIQSVVNVINAGLEILDQYGDRYDYPTEDEDGNEIPPSQDAIIERISFDLREDGYVLAGFQLDCGIVVPKSETILISNFGVGQIVYYMKNNAITKGKITDIQLAEGYGKNHDYRKADVVVLDNSYKMKQNEVFATIDELLKELKEDAE